MKKIVKNKILKNSGITDDCSGLIPRNGRVTMLRWKTTTYVYYTTCQQLALQYKFSAAGARACATLQWCHFVPHFNRFHMGYAPSS